LVVVGQPILAAAGFQPALFASHSVGFRRKRPASDGPPLMGSRLFRVTPSPRTKPWHYCCLEDRMSRRAEWQNVLDAETKKWSAMSCGQLIAALHDTVAYEVEFESKHYNVEVELLENTDTYIHVLVAVDDGSLPAAISPLTSSFIHDKNSEAA
jgi:hypothetical protein